MVSLQQASGLRSGQLENVFLSRRSRKTYGPTWATSAEGSPFFYTAEPVLGDPGIGLLHTEGHRVCGSGPGSKQSKAKKGSQVVIVLRFLLKVANQVQGPEAGSNSTLPGNDRFCFTVRH